MSGGHRASSPPLGAVEGGPRLGMVRPPGARLRLPFGLWVLVGKIGTSVFTVSNSENISRITFLKLKTAENRELALGILSTG